MTRNQKLLLDIGGHLLFWSWNLWLASLLTLGFGPVICWELLVATWMGIVPLQMSGFALALVVIPVLSMGLGLWKLRSSGMQLLTLLYGIEIPLLMLIGVRVFAVHELSAPTWLTLITVLVGMAGLMRMVLHGPKEKQPLLQAGLWVSQLGYALVALWWGAITAIYGIGLAERAVRGVPSFVKSMLEYPDLAVIPIFGFFLLTLLVFLLCPVGMVGIAVRSLQLNWQHGSHTFGIPLLAGSAALVLLLWTTAFGLASRQPQRQVFSTLNAVATDADRRAVLDRLPAIRTGLLSARLGPDCLFEGSPEHIVDLYDLGAIGQVPAAAWSVLMAPFLYDSVHEGTVWVRWNAQPEDVRSATRHYAEVFDADMRRAEKDALIAAARSTWNWEQAAADVFDIGEQKVWLESQTLTHTPQPGGFAKVTLHDVYRNHTFEEQEIVFHFSLPEGAAVTGLSLSDSPDRATAFDQVVAPRGAAQEVYEREVQRRVDPALLEQVGPRQYRLRAFPVQARVGRPDRISEIQGQGPAFHLWVDLTVPSVQSDGEWVSPMPVVSEVRNAYWDASTTRSHAASSWLPATLPGATAPAPQHEIVNGWSIEAVPAVATGRPPTRIPVLIDSTRSMNARQGALVESLSALQAAGVHAELWCTREATIQRCDDFDPSTALFWGNRSLANQLADWPSSGPRLVLTDAGTYGGVPPVLPSADIELPETWLVHLEGFPAAYDDWTLDRVTRSGGGVAATVPEALQRLSDPTVLDGFRWSITPTDEPDTAGSFRPVAARQAIRWLDREGSAALDHLDQQHALATSTSVVTHYSSMIVLVNDWQRQALKDASERSDCFDREANDGEFDSVSSVPEPGTWLLLLTGGLLLGVRQKSKLMRA